MIIDRLTGCLMCVLLSLTAVISDARAASLGDSMAESPHVKVQLLADRYSVAAGQEFHIGVLFQIEEGWHIYWKNPGDSGLPTQVQWISNSSFSFSELQYPAPRRIPFGDLMNFGYENEVLLSSAALSTKADLEAGTTELGAKVQWVLCKDECIPGNAQLALPMSDGSFERAQVQPSEFEKFSSPAQSIQGKQIVSATIGTDSLVLRIPTPAALGFQSEDLVFLPEIPNLLKNFETQKFRKLSDNSIELTVTRLQNGKDFPEKIPGVLLVGKDNGAADPSTALHVEVKLAPAAEHGSNYQPILLMLGSALIGGLILNLMPCVFPVLSLKLLEISRLGASKDAVRHSQVFALGVISSFVALAGLLLGLKSMGLEIGWGFQFQSPTFVAAIALLTFTIGLNLSGVFEIGFSLQNKAGAVRVSESYFGSFVSGILATTLATPCTAPFMGSAIAFALAAPLYQAFLVFLMLGLGMSLPYLVIPAVPGLTRFIPRPGAWMDKFKQALAFPMYATTTWLLWVLGMQADLSAVIACVGALVLISAGMWIFGNWGAIHCSARSRFIAKVATSGMLACALYITISNLPDGKGTRTDGPQLRIADTKDARWERYSDQRLSEVLAEKKVALIDFTAAWCLVCQVNHSRVLENPQIVDSLRDKGVVLLRADWTTRDSEISAALTRFGRSGVPLLVLMNKDGKPQQFESLVNKSELLAAIESLPHVV